MGNNNDCLWRMIAIKLYLVKFPHCSSIGLYPNIESEIPQPWDRVQFQLTNYLLIYNEPQTWGYWWIILMVLTYIFIAVLQHPESQYTLIGSNATFSCRMRYLHSFIIWEATFPNGSRDPRLNSYERADICIVHNRKEESLEYSSTLTVLISPSNAQCWNGTQLQCVGVSGSGSIYSGTSSLVIYKSLSEYSSIAARFAAFMQSLLELASSRGLREGSGNQSMLEHAWKNNEI